METTRQNGIIPFPDSREMECQLLSDLIADSSFIPMAKEYIRGEMFTKREYRELWTQILEMYDKGETIDFTTVYPRTNKVIRDEFLSKVPYTSTSGRIVEGHCQALKEISLRRSIYLASMEMMKMSIDGTDIVTLISKPGELVEKVSINSGTRKGSVHVGEVMNKLAEEIECAIKDREEGKSHKIPTGFVTLDSATYSGWTPGNLIVLSARPSIGKTSIMLQMALEASINGFPAIIYSLEMTKEELMGKIITRDGLLSTRDIAEGTLRFMDFESEVRKYQDLPLSINDSARTLDEIVTDIAIHNQKGDCSIAFIDYLGLIPCLDSKMLPTYAISQITGKLKSIAKKYRIPIVLLSQLNRNSDSENRPPELRDLRDSGSIEQDADIVLMLERPFKNRTISMWIRKNRRGKANVPIRVEANENFSSFLDMGFYEEQLSTR